MHIQRRMTILMLAAMPIAAANAVIIDPGWRDSSHFERNTRIPAGTAIEICGEIPLGTVVTWNFETSAPVTFNVHYHEGPTFREYPVKKSVVKQSSSSLIVEASLPYCWQWGNLTNEPIALAVSFDRK